MRSRRRDADREQVETLRQVGVEQRVVGAIMIRVPVLEVQGERADDEGLLKQLL